MWPEIARYLPEFPSAVLSAFDAEGFPFSLRCHPAPNRFHSDLTLTLPEMIILRPGPACLLFHRHDERLWNLKSFALRGTLARRDGEWSFVPEQLIPGAGIGGLFSYLRFLVNGRRATTRYLKARGLSRPRIPWHEWQELFAAAMSAPLDPITANGTVLTKSHSASATGEP